MDHEYDGKQGYFNEREIGLHLGVALPLILGRPCSRPVLPAVADRLE